MEEDVDEVSLRKAITRKYPCEKSLNTFTCRTGHKGRVTMVRKESEEKMKFYYGQI
jgi:hypothetical protein